MVAMGALAFSRWSARRSEAVLWLSDVPTRGLEPRLSSAAAARHRPLATSPGEGALPAPPARALARLEEQGQLVAIADAYLLRGQVGRARPYLDRAPPGADALATRAALDLLAGQPEDAFRHAAGALRLQSTHAGARWNLALALRDLSLPSAAAQELDAVADRKEPGWAEEARALAGKLREDTWRRAATYKGGLRRCRAAMRGEAPYPLDVLEHSERLARSCFYDVLRAAGTVEEVAKLEAAAAALDARFGGETLAREVARVKAVALDARRPELARTYASAVEAWPGVDVLLALADAAREAEQPDLELGALALVPPGRRDLARHRALALATGDPWFVTLAEEQVADADLQQGQPALALQRLRALEEPCATSNRVVDRCLGVRRGLAEAYVELLQTRQAKEVALRALAMARAEGDWASELRSLKEIAQIERLRGEPDLMQAYLEEALARAPGHCETAEYVRSEVALAHVQRLEFAEARRQVDFLAGCDTPPSLTRMFVLADLQRFRPDKEDERTFRRGLGSARDDMMLGPGEQALITHLRGRAFIEHDRSYSVGKLNRAIAESEQVAATDRSARRARLSSYTSLLLEEGKRGNSSAALRLFAAEGHWPEPPPCSLWMAADAERLLVVSLGPGGEVVWRYDGARRKPATAESDLVPPDVLAAVRECAEVKVIARPPLEGRWDLLPREMAWSAVFRDASAAPSPPPPPPTAAAQLLIASTGLPAPLRMPAPLSPASASLRLPALQGAPLPARSPGPGPHVIVSNPQPPASLRLPEPQSAPPLSWSPSPSRRALAPAPELEAWLSLPAPRSAPPRPGELQLEGQAATPARVLEAMRTASLVELHAHGLLSPGAADASYLALSPEADGRFALTAADVRKARLEGHPLVLLSACHTGETTPVLDEGHGLARAFIEAGARAVLVTASPIPDGELEPFFHPLLERIQSGEAAAAALRDARVARHSTHGPSWTDSVVLFE